MSLTQGLVVLTEKNINGSNLPLFGSKSKPMTIRIQTENLKQSYPLRISSIYTIFWEIFHFRNANVC